MGEPHVYAPLISLDKERGTISFEIETEGAAFMFEIDVDDADRIIGRLELLKQKYREDCLK